MDGVSPVNPASTADAATEAKAAVPKPTVAAAKEEAPKVRDDPPRFAVVLFWAAEDPSFDGARGSGC